MKKKHIYRFNPHTLAYEKVIVTVRDRMKRISTTALLGLVLGVVFMVIGFQLIDSPKERALKREIKQYRRQIRSLNTRMDRISEVLADIEARDDQVYRAIFQTAPIDASVRNSGIGGVERYSEMEGFECSKEIIATSKTIVCIIDANAVFQIRFFDIFSYRFFLISVINNYNLEIITNIIKLANALQIML